VKPEEYAEKWKEATRERRALLFAMDAWKRDAEVKNKSFLLSCARPRRKM